MTVFYGILAFLFAALAIFMMLLILLQKGRGGGLSSAFGGAGGNTAFGTKTGDVFTWATAIVFGLFLLLSMGLIWTQSAITSAANANPDTIDAVGGDLSPGDDSDIPATGDAEPAGDADDALPEVGGDDEMPAVDDSTGDLESGTQDGEEANADQPANDQ